MAEIKAARKPHQRVETYIARNFSFNTPGIGTAANICVGSLPAGCLVTDVIVRIKTAFNAATTNVITLGTSGSASLFAAAGDVDETAVETYFVDVGTGTSITVNTPVYVRYTQSGTAATTGEADVIIRYLPAIK